jgi:hypothetical protein
VQEYNLTKLALLCSKIRLASRRSMGYKIYLDWRRLKRKLDYKLLQNTDLVARMLRDESTD